MNHARADFIYSYSRAQAIEDGVLVDLMVPSFRPIVIMTGFKFPVAMTQTAFSRTVQTETDGDLSPGTGGRLETVLLHLRAAVRKAKGCQAIKFNAVDLGGNEIQLKCVCGPGDDVKPVLTIMVHDED